MEKSIETVAEFLARGGNVRVCEPGTAYGIGKKSQFVSVRHNSSRGRAFRNTKTPYMQLGYAQTGFWNTKGR